MNVVVVVICSEPIDVFYSSVGTSDKKMVECSPSG